MKRFFCLILAVLLLASLAGCIPDTTQTTPSPSEPPETTTQPDATPGATTQPTVPEDTEPSTATPHITGWFGLDGKKYY